MAIKHYLYTDDSTDLSYDIALDDALYGAIYSDVGGVGVVAPTAYADSAALLVAHPGAPLMPPGINPRQLTLDVNGFAGSAAMVMMTQTDLQQTLLNRGIEGLTPFPVAPIAESHLSISILGYRGEQRSSN